MVNLFYHLAVQSTQSSVTIYTVISAVAAAVSAYSAFKSRGFAKKTYSLAEKKYIDQQAKFSLYLVKGSRWSHKAGKNKKLLLFHITINNISDSKSSFKAELEIEYIRPDESVAKVITPHNEKFLDQLPHKNLSIFPNDIRVDERGMLSRWLIFEQPAAVFNEFKIEKYVIKISDTHGNSERIECYIISDIIDENE